MAREKGWKCHSSWGKSSQGRKSWSHLYQAIHRALRFKNIRTGAGVSVVVWLFRKLKNLTTSHNTKQNSFLVLLKEVCCCRNQQVQTQKLLWPLLTLASCTPALSHHGSPVHLRQISFCLWQNDFHLQNRNHWSTVEPGGNIRTVNILKIPNHKFPEDEKNKGACLEPQFRQLPLPIKL